MLFQLCYLYVCLPVDMSIKVFEVNLIRVQKKVRKCTNSNTSQIHFFIFFFDGVLKNIGCKKSELELGV